MNTTLNNSGCNNINTIQPSR